MNLNLLERLKERIGHQSAKIVFPEGNDHRILLAARQLADDQIADIVLLGDKKEIIQLAQQHAVALDGFELIDPHDNPYLSHYAELYISNRTRTKPNIAARLVKKPLNFGAMMVKAGDADLMVAGVNHATRNVIEAAGACIGLATEQGIPSSFFIMCFNNRKPLIFADCALNIDPTVEALATIAIDTGLNAQRLLQEPANVALLSFSTKGSAAHNTVGKVTTALAIVKTRAPTLNIDGELQVDAALEAHIAASKMHDSGTVAGRANVLIFPSLDAGNIGYKLVKHLANAEAIGPILQGFALPVADLSRGATVAEIVATTIVALALR